MRIGVWHNLPSGGGMRALHDQVDGLRRRGHEILVWSPDGSENGLLGLPSSVRQERWAVRRPPPRTNIGSWSEVSRFLSALEDHCRYVARRMEEERCDVLFIGVCRSTRTPPIARFSSIPSTIYLQEPYRPLYEAMPENPWRSPRLSPWRNPSAWWDDRSRLRAMRLQVAEEIRSAKAFSRILVNSRFSRESVLRAYGLDSKVCYLGVDASRFGEPVAPRDHLVGIGAFAPEKNIELAIDAVATLPDPRPELVWVGNVAYKGYVETLQRRAAEKGVRFSPRLALPESELVETIRTARCMVYAPRLEPFGYAPIEAGACGVPVVGIAEGGVRETVEDGVTGFLVDGGPCELGAALGRILADPELARRLGAAGRERALGRWSLEASIDRLEGDLEELVGK